MQSLKKRARVLMNSDTEICSREGGTSRGNWERKQRRHHWGAWGAPGECVAVEAKCKESVKWEKNVFLDSSLGIPQGHFWERSEARRQRNYSSSSFSFYVLSFAIKLCLTTELHHWTNDLCRMFLLCHRCVNHTGNALLENTHSTSIKDSKQFKILPIWGLSSPILPTTAQSFMK